MAGYSVTFSVVDDATKQIDAINRRIAAMRAPMERLSKQVSRFVDVSGLGRVAKGFEWIASAATSVLRTMVEIVPVLGAITGAASIAGMVKLVSTYTSWSQALTQTASNLGVTTQQLQKFEDATRLAGGNVADMDAGLKSLYDASTRVFRGDASADQVGWFNRLNVNIRDATGHLRSLGDLMPEVVAKIGAMKDPGDRAAASAALLGDANNNLVETFRRSHQSFGQWLTDAGRYTELSDKQKGQLQAFAEAQGHVATAFDHLGQQISATLANNLTPLMNMLGDFVDKHQADIIAAVDRISQAFSDWLQNPDNWKKIEEGLTSVVEGLKWVSTHLGEIKLAAEAVAAVFAFKWAVGIVAAIAQVTSAIGTAVGLTGVVAGSGLMGALAGVAALAGILALGSHYETPETQQEREKNRKDMGTAPPSNMPTVDTFVDKDGNRRDSTTQQIVPNGGAKEGYTPGGPWGKPGPLPDAIKTTAVTSKSGVKFNVAPQYADQFQGFLNDLEATGYKVGPGGGGYNRRFIGGTDMPSAHAYGAAIDINPTANPQGGTTQDLPPSVADMAAKHGLYWGGQWSGKTRDPMHFEVAPGGAAGIKSGWEANNPLNLTRKPGEGGTTTPGGLPIRQYGSMEAGVADSVRKLVEYQKQRHLSTVEAMAREWNKTATPEYVAKIAAAIGVKPGDQIDITDPKVAAAWVRAAQPQETGPGHLTEAQIGKGVALALRPDANAPASANGSVDVSITHKNPPPDSAVTATGTGAVNVAPPRVERQQLASI